MDILARSRALAVAVVVCAGCGGTSDLSFDLLYADDCGCPFEDIDLSQGASAGILIVDSLSFEEVSDTCIDLLPAADNSLLDFEPFLADEGRRIEDSDLVDIFVSVYSPVLDAGEQCSRLFDDPRLILFGFRELVPLDKGDKDVRVVMSCADLSLACQI